jgi:hypothetical protein
LSVPLMWVDSNGAVPVSPVRHAAMTASGGKLCPEVERVHRRLESVQSKGEASVVSSIVLLTGFIDKPCVCVSMHLI